MAFFLVSKSESILQGALNGVCFLSYHFPCLLRYPRDQGAFLILFEQGHASTVFYPCMNKDFVQLSRISEGYLSNMNTVESSSQQPSFCAYQMNVENLLSIIICRRSR